MPQQLRIVKSEPLTITDSKPDDPRIARVLTDVEANIQRTLNEPVGAPGSKAADARYRVGDMPQSMDQLTNYMVPALTSGAAGGMVAGARIAGSQLLPHVLAQAAAGGASGIVSGHPVRDAAANVGGAVVGRGIGAVAEKMRPLAVRIIQRAAGSPTFEKPAAAQYLLEEGRGHMTRQNAVELAAEGPASDTLVGRQVHKNAVDLIDRGYQRGLGVNPAALTQTGIISKTVGSPGFTSGVAQTLYNNAPRVQFGGDALAQLVRGFLMQQLTSGGDR